MKKTSMYHEGMRQLQNIRETGPLADRLEETIVHAVFTSEDREFIQRSPMVFVATADAHGSPDCSYKGGLPGFIHILDDNTLVLPDYDGNGMYRSWGNLLVNPNVGLLFIDFEKQKRIRVNGTAQISADDPLRNEFPGAVFIIRVTAEKIFPACPRYIHKMRLEALSVYAPRTDYTPPVPEWKSFPIFCDALPVRDRTGENDG